MNVLKNFPENLSLLLSLEGESTEGPLATDGRGRGNASEGPQGAGGQRGVYVGPVLSELRSVPPTTGGGCADVRVEKSRCREEKLGMK